jgi:hypothetical protein
MALEQFRRRFLAIGFAMAAAVFGGAASGLLGTCGPFTDVAADAFCPFVLEVFFLGITTGTTPTTYDPASNVSRLQMAAFLSRSVDSVLKRGSRRAPLKQFWTTKAQNLGTGGLDLTTMGSGCQQVESDGADLWVANQQANTVSRVRASDGKLLETWTGAGRATGVLSAMNRIFVTGDGNFSNPGSLYRIDPSQPAGVVTTVASNLGNFSNGITYDGTHIWTGNNGSVSIVTPGATIPWTVTTVTAGFSQFVYGALYDGANVWVTDSGAGLRKLDANGAILLTVTVGSLPLFPVFDGTNIWVPNENTPSVSVVRASNGAVLATLTGNGLGDPFTAAFDGQRILVTSHGSNNVSVWKAADLTPLGFVATGVNTNPLGACSDGINFWFTLEGGGLMRF